MKFSAKQYTFIAVLFFVLLYSLFYVYKVRMYELFYYTHDMFSVIGTSIGWTRGHPLWWDNRYGLTPAIHFSYTAPLLSPFIVLFAGRGLFIFHVLIYCLAFFFTIYHVHDKHLLKLRLATLVVFLAGPFAFWVFDDTPYGWHIEMTFIPLSLAFALALVSKRKWLVALFAVLLIFTKEDGIVIGCCIHLLYLLSDNRQSTFNRKKIILIIAGWLLVFIFSFMVIKFLRPDDSSRLEEAIGKLFKKDGLNNLDYFRQISWQFLLMFLPLAVFCFYVLERKNFLKLILLTLPLVITGTVSGLWYAGLTGYSVLWAPRFVAIMGVMLSGTIILMNQETAGKQKYRKAILTIMVTVVLISQGFALVESEYYNLITQLTKAYDHTYIHYVSPADARLIKGISEKTPCDFTAAVPYEYFSAFDKSDLLWIEYPENAPQKNPDLIVLRDSSEFKDYKYDYAEYDTTKEGKFYLLVRNNRVNPFRIK